jgi:SWI2/SNF2 ATPase
LKRDPKSLLWDAREAAELIATITAGKTFAEFDADIVLRSAVERQFEIAASRRTSCASASPTFQPRRFLDLVRHFIVFEDLGGGALAKKIAGYHQFHAVNVAVEETLRAANLAPEAEEAAGTYFARHSPGGAPGDKRVGVVWHTQGSGKSLTMAFYAGRLILHPAMENPTIVVITDRNDLDGQLFTTFARCRDLLRCDPEQAESRADLREKLRRGSGGVVFTTIQKFMPEEKGDRHPVLSERRNIVVIADEAHRSQYDFIDGLARAPARRIAERLVHRLYRHADREDRRQYPRGLRRLHQHLRHPARGHRRRDRADLL